MLEMQVSDFIQNYPDRTDPRFSYKIARLKEFESLKLPVVEHLPKKGEIRPLKHQEMLARYISPHTNYDSCLIWHSLGSGKTCASSLVVEYAKKVVKPENNRPIALILVKNDMMIDNYIDKVAKECTDNVYTVPEDTPDKIRKIRKEVKKVYQVETWGKLLPNIEKMKDKIIKKNYSNRIIIIDEAHHLNTPESGKVSEAKEVRKNYKIMHHFLHTVENCKILLLTGTPIWDKVEDIAGLFNLILPEEEQLPTKKFRKRFIKNGKLINAEELRDRFRGRVSFLRMKLTERINEGVAKPWLDFFKIYPDAMSDFQYNAMIMATKEDREKRKSQMREKREERQRIIEGKRKEKTPLKFGTVGPREEKEKKVALLRDPREASNFVYPNLKIENGKVVEEEDGIWGYKAFKRYAVGRSPGKIKTTALEYSLLPKWVSDRGDEDKIRLNRAFVNMVRSDLPKFSTKLASIIDKIKKGPKELVFIFTGEFVKISGSGAVQLGSILEILEDPRFERVKGLRDMMSPCKEGVNRFAVLTSDAPGTITKTKLTNFLREFNQKKNRYGDYCRIIIGSQAIAEGIDMRNIRQVHIFMPHWNFSKTRQALGRAFRLGSHDDLPPEERFVKVYHHASLKRGLPDKGYAQGQGYPHDASFSSEETMDIRVYKIAEKKESEASEIYRLMKKIAWDCPLNYKRNVLSSDKDGSSVCDYRSCNYECDGFPPSSKKEKVWRYDIPNKNIIRSNYNLFYSCFVVGQLKIRVKEMFRSYFRLDFQNIIKILDVEKDDNILLLRALWEIIETREPMINRYGFRSYLKEKGNIYFLDTQIDPVLSYQTAIYTEYPLITNRTELRSLIQVIELDEDRDKVCTFATNPTINNFDMLNPITKNVILEWIALRENSKDIHVKAVFNTLEREISKHFYRSEDGTLFNDLEKDLRIYDPNSEKWFYATAEDEKKFEKLMEVKKVEKKQAGEQVFEGIPYSFIGIIGKNGKFKIRTKSTVEKGKEKSGQTKGRVCTTYNRQYLLDFFFELGYYPKPPRDFKDRAYTKNLRTQLEKDRNYQSYVKNVKKSVNVLKRNELRSILYLFSLSNNRLCEELEQWFKRPENKRFLFRE